MTTPVLVVPGLGGSGEQHWQSHLERAFPGARRVHQADWDRPDRDAWIWRLAAAVDAAPGAVLVAHSLGCALVAHLAREHPELPVAAALLVAPADVDSARHTPGHIRDFAPLPLLPLSFPSVVVASTNDPYMAFARARGVAHAWNATFVDLGACGHINVASGFGRWPAGQQMLQDLIEGTQPGARKAVHRAVTRAERRIRPPATPAQWR